MVEAVIELLEHGELDPTAQQVADRAGVSLRTVFHHFQSMETVLAECWRVQYERHWEGLHAVPGEGPLADRVEATVQQRTAQFERIAGPRRAAVVWAPRSPVIARGLESARCVLRSMLAETFADELAADGEPEVLLDALDAAASFEAWDLLRRGQQRLPDAHAAALRRSLLALLVPAHPDRP